MKLLQKKWAFKNPIFKCRYHSQKKKLTFCEIYCEDDLRLKVISVVSDLNVCREICERLNKYYESLFQSLS